ncbi:unnamed protein product [Schistocephalus solidus]|uniref:Uncharacterized protein n=1 Tax=Schistocephalus solidus TaxID=70667 RepID=A0A183SM19_SCHSO|nr:unnamed protein product [Schistocephalus solidus]
MQPSYDQLAAGIGHVRPPHLRGPKYQTVRSRHRASSEAILARESSSVFGREENPFRFCLRRLLMLTGFGPGDCDRKLFTRVAAPSHLHLPQYGVYAGDSGPLQVFCVQDPVLPSQLQYSAEAAESEVIQLPGLVRVDGPGLCSVKGRRQDDGILHLQFGVEVTVQTIEKDTGEDLSSDVEQRDASVIITELLVPLSLAQMDDGRVF